MCVAHMENVVLQVYIHCLIIVLNTTNQHIPTSLSDMVFV